VSGEFEELSQEGIRDEGLVEFSGE